MSTPSSEVTQLLAAAAQGDPAAFNELWPLVYDELHRLAQRHMARQSNGATLQTTALVHEAYLRLAQQEDKGWENRVHFFAVAATAMRHILVDHARARQRDKRGGAAVQVSLAAADKVDEQAWELLALDDALTTLATLDAQQSRLVELRFFGGLTMEETAAALNLSLSTAEREWRTARAWLRLELKKIEVAMTPERWTQIKGVFQAALDCEPRVRAAWLDEACAGDAELRREVEALLAADATADEHTTWSLGGAAAAVLAEPPDAMAGRRLGAYRITGLIGQGGMGAVYAAVRDDDQYRQQVAIKLVRTELTGAGAEPVLQRFRRERQILARLAHPNIARLLDGGATPAGWPYLVMEYIEGQPLTDYCTAQGLTVQQRLALFRTVCAAVEYAHRNLVIHRDLKPSNILVTKDGTPKLLDFGIAKLLEAEPTTEGGYVDLAKTATAMRVMTPNYASPEQVRGETVTTATDVYSLGVVLYELLTGVRPHHFTGHSFAEFERVICNVEPERPSAAARRHTGSLKAGKQLAGDLDNIILMALRKEPARRYQSVEQFAEDLRRHLDGLPVNARQDTLRYRAGKFVGRHRWGVAALALIALLLIGGAAFSTYQARRAERRFQQVRKLANTLLFEFDGKIQNITGTTEARELLVKTALEYLNSLAQEAGGDTELQYELATAYGRVADVQGNPRMSNLGHTAEAIASYQKALAMAQALVTRTPQNLKYQRLLAGVYLNLGMTQQQAGAYTAALASHQRGVALIEPLAAQPHATQADLAQLMQGYRLMADLEVEWVPNVAAGVRHYRQALEIAERLARAFPGDQAQYQLAVRHSELAYALLQVGDAQTSLQESQASLALLEPLAAQHPHEARYRRSLYVSLQQLGMAQGQPLGVNLYDTAAALQTFTQMQVIARQFVNADAKDQRARDDFVVGLILTGETEAVKEPARGAATLRQALEALRALAAGGGDPFRYRLLQTETLTRLTEAELRQRHTAVALQHLRAAQTVWQTLAAEQPDEFSVKDNHCELQQMQAAILQAQGDFDGARTALRAALSFAEAERAAKPDDVRAIWRLADVYQKFGEVDDASAPRDPRRPGCNWYQKSLQQWDEWPRHGVSSVFNTTRREAVAQAVARCAARLKQQANDRVYPWP